MPASVFGIISLTMTGLSFIFLVTGTATPNWVSYKALDFHGGLWEKCNAKQRVHENCIIIFKTTESMLDSVRGCEVSACILCGFAFLASLGYMIQSVSARAYRRMGASVLFGILAGLLGLIGAFVFAGEYSKESDYDYKLGYSFGFCVLGGLIVLLNIPFQILERRRLRDNVLE